MAALVL
jgi:hypothetical protein